MKTTLFKRFNNILNIFIIFEMTLEISIIMFSLCLFDKIIFKSILFVT